MATPQPTPTPGLAVPQAPGTAQAAPAQQQDPGSVVVNPALFSLLDKMGIPHNDPAVQPLAQWFDQLPPDSQQAALDYINKQMAGGQDYVHKPWWSPFKSVAPGEDAPFADASPAGKISALLNDVQNSAAVKPASQTSPATPAPSSALGPSLATGAEPPALTQDVPLDQLNQQVFGAENWQAQYQQYLDNFYQARDLSGHKRAQPMSSDEYQQRIQQQQATGPLFSAMQAIAFGWERETGKPLTGDVAREVWARLQAMDPVALADLAAQVNWRRTSGMTGAGSQTQSAFFADLYSDLKTALPWLSQLTSREGQAADPMKAAHDQADSLFLRYLGRYPTDTELQNAGLIGKDANAIEQWILGQQQPGVNNMTVGAYTSGYSRLKDQWLQYYGTLPTTADIQWSIGRTPEEIQQHINDSPSHVSGVTIGQYQGLQKLSNDVSGQLFGYGDNKDFLHSLAQATKGPNAKP